MTTIQHGETHEHIEPNQQEPNQPSLVFGSETTRLAVPDNVSELTNNPDVANTTPANQQVQQEDAVAPVEASTVPASEAESTLSAKATPLQTETATPEHTSWWTPNRRIAGAALAVTSILGIGGGVVHANSDTEPQVIEQPTPANSPQAVAAPNPSVSPSAIPSEVASPAPEVITAEDYRAITDLAQYYSLPPETRLMVNWALYEHVQNDGYYNWALNVPVDPNEPFGGFYDWNPVKNTPLPTDSGDKIMQSILFERAVVLSQTTDPHASDRQGSRDIDQLGAKQTMAGIVLNPNDPATQGLLDSLNNSLDSTDWQVYRQDQFLNVRVVDTKEADGGQPITSDDGLPAKWITVTNITDAEQKTATYKVEYVTFTDESGTTQHLWVPTSLVNN